MKNKLGIENRTDLFDWEIGYFIDEVRHHNISVDYKKIDDLEFYHSIEWLIPPAIVFFISKPFIESFLQEAGKDAYIGLKSSIKKLLNKSKSEEFKYFNSSGKSINASHIGLLVELEEIRVTLKINFPPDLTDEDAIDKLFECLSPVNRSVLVNMVRDFVLQCEFPKKFPAKEAYLEYNNESGEWECFDIIQKVKEMRLSQKDK